MAGLGSPHSADGWASAPNCRVAGASRDGRMHGHTERRTEQPPLALGGAAPRVRRPPADGRPAPAVVLHLFDALMRWLREPWIAGSNEFGPTPEFTGGPKRSFGPSGGMTGSAARIKRKDGDMERQTGATTRQMEQAPQGAVFVWCNHHLDYPQALAQKLGRDDLEIVGPTWLEGHAWYGLRISGIVLDHAAYLSDSQQYGLSKVLTRVTPNVEVTGAARALSRSVRVDRRVGYAGAEYASLGLKWKASDRFDG
ncbi:MAG: hypothetical protein AMXMBFR84_51280 [Candidatus Hydrogenedentota bacterium]